MCCNDGAGQWLANDWVKKWNRAFDCVQTIQEHSGSILALTVTRSNNYLVSGASDKMIKVCRWLEMNCREGGSGVDNHMIETNNRSFGISQCWRRKKNWKSERYSNRIE